MKTNVKSLVRWFVLAGGFSGALAHAAPSKQVDILWVIDNSGSAYKYQQRVIDGAATLHQALKTKNADWKMGILSSDFKDKPYVGFDGWPAISSSSADPTRELQTVFTRLGAGGSGTETFFTPVMQALANEPTFVRRGSTLAVVALTDAREQSERDSKTFASFLKNAVSAPDQARFFAILGADDLGCHGNLLAGEGEWTYVGSPFEEAVQGTGGKAFTLCEPKFEDTLTSLVNEILP